MSFGAGARRSAAPDLIDLERQSASAKQRTRQAELDAVRRMLEARAAEVEAAAAEVQRERAALALQYSSKIRELGDAKRKLEVQVRPPAAAAACDAPPLRSHTVSHARRSPPAGDAAGGERGGAAL